MKMWAKIVTAPAVGLAFAVFLPAIGIIMAVYLCFRKVLPEMGVRYDPLYNYFCRNAK